MGRKLGERDGEPKRRNREAVGPRVQKKSSKLKTVGGDKRNKIRVQTKSSERTFGVQVKAIKSVWRRWESQA